MTTIMQKETYNYFGCEGISDYNDLYDKTDVLLLVDVFTAYRKKCIKFMV